MIKLWIYLFDVLKKLRTKYRNLKEKWTNAKTPRQKWQCIYSTGNFFAELLGVQVYSDMKNYWWTATGGILGLLYIFITIYTVQFYLRQNNFTRALACSYPFGLFTLVSSILLI